MDKKIAFIGAGSMAESIIGGLIADELLPPHHILAVNHSNEARLTHLQENYGIRTFSDSADAAQEADIVMLAVKPKQLGDALHAAASGLTEDKIIMSVLAGIKTSQIENELPGNHPVIRVMPNTSAKVGQSATALAGGSYAKEQHVQAASELFSSIGTAVVVKEKDMNTVTGIAGSGPAYFYYFAEAMEQAAAASGLPEDKARDLIIQTMYGAAVRMRESDQSSAALYQEVRSPGGTTEAAFREMEKHDLQKSFKQSVQAAISRAAALGENNPPPGSS
ncbi:pyrroline-5-carboxylate reductase [Salibacterium halotolerans]|uniref:Pyrroline-5-carboxylate reductase n=1 Tax=Salibacterium halotolerans TaxID=1884432 RepID=A0A1I5M2E8_9BACI|nr:pyrroline-5-carboxylate reductase [Salibacterium halotolerans]SFP03818.1 pyrroline-5-carboxylate reductase [Salibacterium halotolerans]